VGGVRRRGRDRFAESWSATPDARPSATSVRGARDPLAEAAFAPKVRNEAARGENISGDAAEWRPRFPAAGALVDDRRAGRVDRQRDGVALDDVARIALDRQQAIVDRVAIEAARKAPGEDDR